MVQAEGLMVGNWLFRNDCRADNEAIQVGEINANNKLIRDTEDGTYSYDHLKPIPLSREILEKCGFKKDYTGFSFTDKMSLSISITKNGEYLPCWLDKCLFPNGARVLKYLHELQNLFFVLTGGELKIELLENIIFIQGTMPGDLTLKGKQHETD